MASVVIASVPLHGHVTPMLMAAKGFVARGDDVRFVTGARFADKVAATGATFVPLPDEADYDDRSLFDGFPERVKLKGVKADAFDIERIVAPPARAQYQSLVDVLAARPADALLAEPNFLGAALLLAHRRPDRPAVVTCGVVPLMIDGVDTAPVGMGLPPARVLNRRRNALLAVASRRVLRRPFQVVDALHRELHGTDMPFTFLDWGRHADALVQFTVPSLEYPRTDAPAELHFVGPLWGNDSRVPLPDWWGDLDGSRPVVHVTQGTLANTDYGQTIAPTLRALAGDDVLVVVATGGRPLSTLPPLPANARAATYLPYDELLSRTDVYVTNGGYGGVHYALRHGVPIVVTGGKEDKAEVGARVAWTGVGRRIRSEHPTPRVMRRNIRAVLDRPRYREASQRLAADIASAPGFAGLAGVVDRLVTGPASTTAQPDSQSAS